MFRKIDNMIIIYDLRSVYFYLDKWLIQHKTTHYVAALYFYVSALQVLAIKFVQTHILTTSTIDSI